MNQRDRDRLERLEAYVHDAEPPTPSVESILAYHVESSGITIAEARADYEPTAAMPERSTATTLWAAAQNAAAREGVDQEIVYADALELLNGAAAYERRR